MRFTLRQLQVFVAACETESVTLAAERERLTQSAASSAIAQLEKSVGFQLLLRRHAQGVAPTPAGRLFLDHAYAVLREAARLDLIADELGEAVAGTLELGSLVTLAPIVVPSLCRGFQERFPGVIIRIVEGGQSELLRALREGRLSLALTYDLGLTEGVAFQRLAELPPVALLAGNHPLARRRRVSLRQLAPEPLVLLDLPLSRDYFLGLFAAEGIAPLVEQRSPHLEVVRSLVANGFGYSLVNARPDADTALDGRPIATVPLTGDHRPMLLGLASLAAGREPRVVTAFREHCAAAVTEDHIPGMRLSEST